MKIIFSLLFLSIAGFAAAQNHYPVLSSKGDSAAAFVPAKWHIMYQVQYGDLNKDKLEDAAFVIESDDTMSEYLYDAETQKYDDLEHGINPRILVVLFKNADGTYRLALQNNDFILRVFEGGMCCDPYESEDITIKNGTLRLAFNGGLSRTKWENTYVFRYQKNDWYLIGASIAYIYIDYGDHNEDGSDDSVKISREETSYNFITGKVEITTNDDTDNPASQAKIIKKTLPEMPLPTFKTLIRPMTWEIEKGEFL